MQLERNIQDQYLNLVRRQKQNITVFLVNGFQMRGKILGFDNFVLLLDVDGKQQMIYKHAISTLVPQSPISLETC